MEGAVRQPSAGTEAPGAMGFGRFAKQLVTYF